MKNPRFSIICPAFNHERYVAWFIDSVLAQTVSDWELVIVDDCSSDNTAKIIKSYTDKRIKFIQHKINGGINAAINTGVENATGEYIMFLDGDDYYCDKSFFKQALKIFNNNSNVGCCAFNYKYLYPDGSEKTNDQCMKSGLIKAKDYISNGMYTHSGACVFRNVIDRKKLDLLLRINNFDDNAITVYMLQFGDIYYFDKPVYIYRQTNDSLWNSVNSIEQDLINAFDYKLICDSAPSLKHEVAKRQYRAIKSIYKNKSKLYKQLSDKYTKYVSVAQSNGDVFIYNLLKWNDLSLLQKIKTVFMWKKIK